MKLSIVTNLIIICLLCCTVLHGQIKIDVEFTDPIADNPIYQRVSEQRLEMVRKYNVIRDTILTSDLSLEDKGMCLDLIKVMYKDPEFLLHSWDQIEAHHPMVDYVPADSLRRDIWHHFHNTALKDYIKKHYAAKAMDIRVTNDSILDREHKLFDKLDDKLVPSGATTLLRGAIDIECLQDRADLQYTYSSTDDPYPLQYMWYNYNMHKSNKALSELSVSFYLENDMNQQTKYDCVVDLNRLVNIEKDELEERINSLSQLVVDNGIMIIEMSAAVMRYPWEDGEVYCSSDEEAHRIPKKKIKKMAARHGFEYVDKLSYDHIGTDFLMLRKVGGIDNLSSY